MNQTSIILFALALILISLLLRRMSSASSRSQGDSREELPDMNEIFLRHAGGRRVVDLVKVFNPSDTMILRSLLASEGIDSYVKSNHFGELYGCARESIFSTEVISVFKDSSEDGREIVKQYIGNLRIDGLSRDDIREEQGETASSPSSGLSLPASDLKYIPELLS